MSRELKLALIVGFSLVLVVSVLIADHFAGIRKGDLAPAIGDRPGSLTMVGASTPTPPRIDPFKPVKPLDESKPSLPKSGSNPGQSPDSPEIIDQTKKGSASELPKGGGETPIAPADVEYTILDGDTLYGVAKKFYKNGGLCTKLSEYNGLGDGRSLRVGIKIKVPHLDVLSGKAIPVKTEELRTSPLDLTKLPDVISAKETTVLYTIKDGDTLSSIARKVLRAERRMSEILELNPELRGREDRLRLGTQIKLPKITG